MERTSTQTQSAIYPILWACVSSWYYGYHLSELNFPATSLTCSTPDSAPSSRLPLCLDLDTQRYGLVTAVYTVGGLIGSLSSSWLVEKKGVKGGITWTGWLNLIGVLFMSLAPHWVSLAVGRLFAGVSSGIAICLVPPFLSFIAKSSPQLANRSGQVGTLNQMAIVIGLFTAQCAGMAFTGPKGDAPGKWRYITAASGVVSVLQLLAGPYIVSPGKTAALDADPESNTAAPSADEASPLLSEHPQSSETQLSLRDLLSNTSFRGPTLLCAAFMALQQLSGVNAVMFYSTPVLKPLLPGSAGTIGIGITLVNALMTIVAIFLIDRLGRRFLLLASTIGMSIMSFLLAYGLDSNLNALSAVAIILFIVGYSNGLGPVPFLLVSELVPGPGIPALASLSLSLSWVTTFIIAISFLPLRDALSTPTDPHDPTSDRLGEGRIFYIFTVMCASACVLAWRGLGKPSQAP